MAGMVLGPAIVLAGRDPSGRIWPWLLLTGVFLSLLIHRLGLSYELTEESLSIISWWGLGRPERVTLAGIESAEVLKGLALSVVGCGHVLVRSGLPDEGGLTILAQPRAEELARQLEALGRAAKAKAAQGAPAHPPGLFDSL
jgi:hypothetical protein